MTEEMKASTQRFKAALDRIQSGESEVEVVEMSSGKVRLAPDPDTPTGVKIEPLEGESGEVSRPQIDPERLAAMERMREASERVGKGESEFEEVLLHDGKMVRISRDPEMPGAIVVGSLDGTENFRSMTFPATPARPDHYPEDLPFLPDCGAGFMEMVGSATRTLTWFSPTDPEPRLEELLTQLREGGWEPGEETKASTPMGTVRVWTFRRGGRVISLRFSHFGGKGVLNLMEGSKEGSEAAT